VRIVEALIKPDELCGIGETAIAAAAAAWQEQMDTEDCGYQAPFVANDVRAEVVEAAAIFNSNAGRVSFFSSFTHPPSMQVAAIALTLAKCGARASNTDPIPHPTRQP
jgi:hypothetical protein